MEEIKKRTCGSEGGWLFIAIAIIVGGWLLRSGIVHFKDSDRAVEVRGLAEQEVKADRAIWPLVYKIAGNDLNALYNQMETSNNTITAFLKANGIEDKEITIAPASVVDMNAERYVSNDVRYRYNLTAVLTVSTSKVDQIIQLMSKQGDLLKQGIAINGDNDYQHNTQFIFSSKALNELKPKMIEDATRNARATAEKFAHDSDSKLGKIKTATQGLFSIEDRDANTPYIKIVRVVTSVDYFLKD